MTKKPIIPIKDVPTLTDEQVLLYGNDIIPTSMIPIVWKSKTGRSYDRTAPLHARLAGKIVPMGKNRNRLYFWRHDVVAATPNPKMGKPPGSTQIDDKSSSKTDNKMY